jgi:hypothetical protein
LGINLWMSTTWCPPLLSSVVRCYPLMTAADKSLLRGFADLKSALSAICRLEVGVVGRLSADCRQNCRLEVGIWRRPEAYSVIYGGIGIFQRQKQRAKSRCLLLRRSAKRSPTASTNYH